MLALVKEEHGIINEAHHRTPVLELIKANTLDAAARHLMIISSGDAAVGILEQYLKE